MPYVIVLDRVGEIERRELFDEPVLIGRSAECDLSIKDIVLSRKHCRLEKVDGQWTVVDLNSKNGTTVDKLPVIERNVLANEQVIRAGRLKFIFFEGDIANAPPAPPKRDRPADPTESLAGTVAGFEYKAPAEEAAAVEQMVKDRAAKIPVPKEGRRPAGPKPTPQPKAVATIDRDQQMFDILSAIELPEAQLVSSSGLVSELPAAEMTEEFSRNKSVVTDSPGTGVAKARPAAPKLEMSADLSRGSRVWRGVRSTVRKAWSKMTGWSSNDRRNAPEPSRVVS